LADTAHAAVEDGIDMKNARLTTIITWYQRPELAKTLRHNAPLLAAIGSGIIVVNCGGDGDELARMLSRVKGATVAQIDLAAPRFNKSLALNMGIHYAGTDALLLLDGDIMLTGSLLPHIELCERRDCFVVFSGVRELVPEPLPIQLSSDSYLRTVSEERFMHFEWSDGTETKILAAWFDRGAGLRLGPGLVMVRKSHLLRIGGYRSDFCGWGWEDMDVHLRLQRGAKLEPIYVYDEVVHVTHGDDHRDLGGGDKYASDRENFLTACRSYSTGEFGGTFDADVREWESACVRRTTARIPKVHAEE
jgi:hypothetical protein